MENYFCKMFKDYYQTFLVFSHYIYKYKEMTSFNYFFRIVSVCVYVCVYV